MKQETQLHVLATAKASVLLVGQTNQGQVKFIGKVMNKEQSEKNHVVFDIIPEGVFIPYHPEHIDYLKKGSLLALDEQTALKAGVPLHIIGK
jgi:hypothetical protein